ncbi:MAG: DUF5018 domain-containing protein [Candidatus Cryptobacteroides sp.]
MKQKYSLIVLCALAFLASCQKPEYVLPTADRQSITSISAYFNSGDYNGLLLARLEVGEFPSDGRFVIEVPYYYPEESDDQTTMYMTNVRVKAELADDCRISPPLTVMNLYEENQFTFTDAKGESRPIVITGKRVKSSTATLRSFVLDNPPIEGFIDDDEKTIYLFTTDDLSNCTASATVSAHASLSTDLTKPRDYNNPQEVVLLAPNEKDEIVYTTQKAIPTKISHGFNKSSVRQLFNFEPSSRIGTPAYTAATNPSLASLEGYLVVCMGDGSTPVYLDGQTGAKKGEIVLGSAQAGSIASDEAGNMLICNHISDDPYSGILSFYKTSSVTAAPVLFYEYDTETVLPRGGKMEVSGNLDGDAMITVIYEGVSGVTAAQKFISIKVSGGSVVEAKDVDVSGAGIQWGAVPVNAGAVAPASGTGEDGWFYATYGDGTPVVAWIRPDGSLAFSRSTSSGTAWAWNVNQLDCKNYNNADYLALLILSHFPAWGVAPTLIVYDVTDKTNFNGEFDTSDAIVVGTEIEWFQFVNADDSNSCGDVVIVPSADGYKVFIYYLDQYAGVIGGYVADCIKKM